MLTQLFNIPRDQHFWLACSGGSDSMAVSDFYHRGGKNFTLAYFCHGTPQSWEMGSCVDAWAIEHKVGARYGFLSKERPKDQSPEEFWRNERYEWLQSVACGEPIVICQHLDDAVEGWIFSCLHGNPKLIPAKRDSIWRPFLLNTKEQMLDWAKQHNVPYVEDKSNADTHYPRNHIRHNILPLCLQVNPGLRKTIRKKIIAAHKETSTCA